ncbi:MAG: hypothetical protein QM783_19450 [Phycisphaerales bacterium]
MSSFNATDYFGSGPHTFTVGPRGQQWARSIDLGTPVAGIQTLGDHTPTIEVRGRLTAADATALNTLTGALEAAAGTKGTLTDDSGRSWSDVTFVEIAYDGPPQTGRLISLGYRALFAAL